MCVCVCVILTARRDVSDKALRQPGRLANVDVNRRVAGLSSASCHRPHAGGAGTSG